MPCKKETTTRERKKKSKSNKTIYSQKHIRLQQALKDKAKK